MGAGKGRGWETKSAGRELGGRARVLLLRHIFNREPQYSSSDDEDILLSSFATRSSLLRLAFLPTHASPGLCCEGTPLRVHHLQQRSAYLQARLGIADSYLSVLHHSLGTHIRAPALTVSDPSLACSLRASMSYQPTMAQPTLPKTGKVSSRRKGSSNPPVILRSYAEPRTSQDALERTQLVRFAQRSVAHTCWPSADRWTRLIRMSTTTSIPFMPVVLLQSHPP